VYSVVSLFVLGDGVQFVSKLLYVLIGEFSNVDDNYDNFDYQ